MSKDFDKKATEFDLTPIGRQIEEFRNLKVYPLEPFSLALAIGEVDKRTGLPGISMGTVSEWAGRSGTFKSGTAENLSKSVLNDDPDNRVVGLFFEEPNLRRMENVGLDLDRFYTLDFYDPEKAQSLSWADEGLNRLIRLGSELKEVKLCIIDSLGAMASQKELFNDKGEFKDLNETPQMAARASLITKFINQWCAIRPVSQRPILMMLNHMKDKIDPIGPAALKNVVLGEDIKKRTLGGTGKDFACHLRVECKSSPIYEEDGKVKHPLFGNRVQVGLEVIYEVFKNKSANEQGARRAIGRFSFKDQRFDVEEEILNYAEYLSIDGISGASGWWKLPGRDKSIRTDEALIYLRENGLLVDDLKIKITKESARLFGVEKKKPKTEVVL